MLKRLIISLTMLSIIAFSVPSFAKTLAPNEEYDPMFAIADVVLMRPLGLAATIVGAALFVGLSPITALAHISPPHDAFEKLGYALVVTPAEYTFNRPVGVKGVEKINVPPGTANVKSMTATTTGLDTKVVKDKDSDLDGIADYLDRCPNTPTGAIADKDGCWAYHGVFFDFDKDEIKIEFQPLFDNAVIVLNLNPDLTVEIQGHTDNIGAAEYNQKLSERRAQAVKDYLISRGIDPARLTVKGYGMAKPIASNDSKEGQAYNRRVYFERTDIYLEK